MSIPFVVTAVIAAVILVILGTVIMTISSTITLCRETRPLDFANLAHLGPQVVQVVKWCKWCLGSLRAHLAPPPHPPTPPPPRKTKMGQFAYKLGQASALASWHIVLSLHCIAVALVSNLNMDSAFRGT